MTVLHLGVVVQPYAYKGRKGITTFDVAQILEKKYGIMSVYWRVREKQNIAALEHSVAGAIESRFMGAPRVDPLAAACQQIQSGFKDFIASKQAETVGIPGTPTKAALMGINHRKKNPRTGVRRPSFLDTGLYMASFRVWVD